MKSALFRTSEFEWRLLCASHNSIKRCCCCCGSVLNNEDDIKLVSIKKCIGGSVMIPQDVCSMGTLRKVWHNRSGAHLLTGITLAHTASTDVFVRSLKRSRPRPLTIREDPNYRLWRLIHLRQHRVSLFHPLMGFLGQTQHILSVSVGFLPEFSSAHFTGYYSYHSLFLFKCMRAPSCKRTAFVLFYFIYLFIEKVKSPLINMSTDVHHVNMADLATPANSVLYFGIFCLLFFCKLPLCLCPSSACSHRHFVALLRSSAENMSFWRLLPKGCLPGCLFAPNGHVSAEMQRFFPSYSRVAFQ